MQHGQDDSFEFKLHKQHCVSCWVIICCTLTWILSVQLSCQYQYSTTVIAMNMFITTFYMGNCIKGAISVVENALQHISEAQAIRMSTDHSTGLVLPFQWIHFLDACHWGSGKSWSLASSIVQYLDSICNLSGMITYPFSEYISSWLIARHLCL